MPGALMHNQKLRCYLKNRDQPQTGYENRSRTEKNKTASESMVLVPGPDFGKIVESRIRRFLVLEPTIHKLLEEKQF